MATKHLESFDSFYVKDGQRIGSLTTTRIAFPACISEKNIDSQHTRMSIEYIIPYRENRGRKYKKNKRAIIWKKKRI